MSLEAALAYLEKRGYADRVTVTEASTATVELAAAALGVEPARIAKTLSFSIGDEAILIVCAGDTKIDNKKYKAQFNVKAKMLSHDEAAEKIGHAVGGVCPFGVKNGVKIYADISLKRFDIIFPAAGSSNSMARLTPDEMFDISSCEAWVDVCKYAE